MKVRLYAVAGSDSDVNRNRLRVLARFQTRFGSVIRRKRMTATEISLESQKDVQFLKSNISLATREKLDTHLPPSAVPKIHDDTLRKRVEEMLDDVTVHKTELRLISVCITGI
jgi:hypothetical protein